jgi:hypothetical protein
MEEKPILKDSFELLLRTFSFSRRPWPSLYASPSACNASEVVLKLLLRPNSTVSCALVEVLAQPDFKLARTGYSAGGAQLGCSGPGSVWVFCCGALWAGPSTCYAQGRTWLGHRVWRGRGKLLVWACPGSEGDAFPCQRKGACRWRRVGPVGPVS